MPLRSSAPFANTSMRGDPLRSVQATAVGDEVSSPLPVPRQPDQLLPLYVLINIARLVPRTNANIRLLVEVTPGISPQLWLYRIGNGPFGERWYSSPLMIGLIMLELLL